MKFHVWKSMFWRRLLILIPINLFCIFIIILLFIAPQIIMVFSIIVILVILSTLILNINFGFGLKILGSVIYFEENIIQIKFLKKFKALMEYNEIVEYGDFIVSTRSKKTKFIFLSRISFTEKQRKKIFTLGLKSGDVVILKYCDKAMEFLKDKLTIPPTDISSITY